MHSMFLIMCRFLGFLAWAMCFCAGWIMALLVTDYWQGVPVSPYLIALLFCLALLLFWLGCVVRRLFYDLGEA